VIGPELHLFLQSKVSHIKPPLKDSSKLCWIVKKHIKTAKSFFLSLFLDSIENMFIILDCFPFKILDNTVPRYTFWELELIIV